MVAVQHGYSMAVCLVGDCLIGAQHALFDQTVRIEPLLHVDAAKPALFVVDGFLFCDIQVDAALAIHEQGGIGKAFDGAAEQAA